MDKVVVFGGSGFLGKPVVDELTRRGYSVTVFDIAEPDSLLDGQNYVKGDILNQSQVSQVVSNSRFVYNFAGVADLEYAHNNPIETIETNIRGNLYILDACVKNQVERYLYASSIYVYSGKGTFYRCSKQSCELMIEAYHEVSQLHYTILRYGSLYGHGARATNWIYKILKEAIETGKIVREGDGEELREYIHIHDAAKATVDVLDDRFADKHIMITGNQKIKIRHLIQMIQEMMENKIRIEYRPATDSVHYEITPYVFKPRLAERLVINPHIDLGEGILDCLYKLREESDQNPGV